MNFNPANNMLLSDGSFSVRNIMLAAHQKARREMTEYQKSRLYTADDAVFWTYARHFKEAIQWAWDRVRSLKSLVAKGCVA